MVEAVARNFDLGIVDYYDETDRKRGYVASKNRKGETEDFPIMTISMAGVDLGRGGYGKYIEVNDVCAELKKKSKPRPGSVFSMDQRRTR